MRFIPVLADDQENIKDLSQLAAGIVREYFTPIIGAAQNEYMIEKFQTEEAIRQQLKEGYRYYFVDDGEKPIGFLAFFPKAEKLYLSKFYLLRTERGNGYAGKMLEFVSDQARNVGLSAVFLNVNRNNPVVKAYEHMGFRIIREEKNDIGGGFVMDDYVMEYCLE